ncbi:hypothetical protein [Actinacidiphila sp. bgisy144]|uniref:hypothetical protein n=1 Tax=Actinacidiphila sp. bgisy144 TaxID=3413791 RepID=UPI003EBAF1CD
MGLFRREPSTPVNPAMAELGRQFAIAKRHGDRKTVRRIAREYDDTAQNDADAASFQHGQDAYNALPPAYRTRRGNRRR